MVSIELYVLCINNFWHRLHYFLAFIIAVGKLQGDD